MPEPFPEMREQKPPSERRGRRVGDTTLEIRSRLETVRSKPGAWFLVMAWPTRRSANAWKQNHARSVQLKGFELRAVYSSNRDDGSELYARYIGNGEDSP